MHRVTHRSAFAALLAGLGTLAVPSAALLAGLGTLAVPSAALLAGLGTLAVAWGWPFPARAGPLVEARLAFHARPHVSKSLCRPAETGGPAPTDVPCSRFVTQVKVGEPYDVYLLATGVPPAAGLAAFACGITYDARYGKGVDVLGWTHCALLDIPVAGFQGAWPAPGAGIQLIWKVDTDCQRRTVPGYEDQGVHVVGGALYCYAYSEDALAIVPADRRSDDFQLALVDCAIREVELQDDAVGRLAFSDPGGPEGCNPCRGPCADKPDCRVEPARIDFGEVLLGESKDRTIRVRNLGPGRLRLRPVAGCFQFVVTQGGGVRVLAPGEEARVVVRFTPFTTGESACEADLGTACAPVILTATGVFPSEAPDPPEEHLQVRGRPGRERFQLAIRLPEAGPVALDLFDVQGRRIARLRESWTEAGEHVVDWDPRGLTAGVYFVRLAAGNITDAARVVVIP